MDKTLAKTVQAEVFDAVKDIYAKHGLQITSNRSTFDASTFNINIKAIVPDPEEQSKTWAKYATVYGLPTDGVGKVITLNRKQYRIVGLDLSRSRFNVRVAEVATGKQALFEDAAVARALAVAV